MNLKSLMLGLIINAVLLVILLAVVMYFGQFKYKVTIDRWTYHCNEYRIEDNRLYLEDCNTKDTIINNPVNYRIEER